MDPVLSLQIRDQTAVLDQPSPQDVGETLLNNRWPLMSSSFGSDMHEKREPLHSRTTRRRSGSSG